MRGESRYARWTTPDPLADKYYSTSPYAFCNNNPVNFVDPDGRSWYYNSETGQFVAHLEDEDDYIYLITPDQIKNANGSKKVLLTYRSDENLFGQQALEGTIQKSVADAVVSDLYNRVNMTVDGNKFLNEEITVVVSNIEADAQVRPKSGIIEVNRSLLYKGYDTILLLAHEIGYLIDVANETLSDNKPQREKSADKFAENHWSHEKTSEYMRRKFIHHAQQTY